MFELLRKTRTAPESRGFYDRVATRVNEFALVKNEEGEVVFETTSTDFCGNGPKIVITISTNESGKWHVSHTQGGMSMNLMRGVDLDNRLARRRAFWHAVQYMKGRDLKFPDVYDPIRHDDDASLFDVDAYFKNGNPVDTDPFGEFIRN